MIHYEDSFDLDSSWKFAPRMWGHSLHKLAPYIGSYPPCLPHYFISRYSDPGDIVLDPFSGGGTTALEALLLNRQAIGSDSFPYAFVLSAAKSNPLSEQTFEAYLCAKLKEAQAQPKGLALLDNPDMLIFYHEETLDELIRLRAVLQEDDSDAALFLKAVVCGILHGPSKMFLSLSMKDTVSSTPNYVRRYAKEHNLERPLRSVLECAMNKVCRSLKDGLPHENGKTLLSSADSTPLADSSVNLVVTSPPYMSVLDYSWNNWIRLWWLGEDRKAARATMTLTGQEGVYRSFMQNVAREMYRVLKPDSAYVIVVGDVKRTKLGGETRFINSALLIAEEAVKEGFEVECIINDPYKFKNRSMLVFNSLKWDYDPNSHEEKSSVPIDRCLVLRKGRIQPRDFQAPWINTSAIDQLSLVFSEVRSQYKILSEG